MEIRELDENDLESLLELYVQLDSKNALCSTSRSKEIWREIRKNENIKYIGAIEGDMVVASCYIVIIPNLTAGGRSIGFIENVITDSKYRKMGIGKMVMEKAIQIARERGCYKVILQSGIHRREAHEFYRKLGFDDTTKIAFDMRLK